MASRDLNDLIPDFKPKAEKLIAACKSRGIEMRPSATLRSPFEQAVLWRQSRTLLEINQQIQKFKNAGANFLAFCLESAGPQNGKHVTDSPPGLSWHQWGEALDCFWVVNGQAEWSTTKKVNGLNGYQVYADEAEKLGLTAGGHWNKFKDWPHAQFSSAKNPQSVHSILEIDKDMKARFGGQG
ncbi:MAG: peptidoglycan LD-endopeptidase CwlK [Acidobacteriota bacterium]|nr:peptidoglycan LD-endopeptidase CwlK [Acidobacteriota bacterium]